LVAPESLDELKELLAFFKTHTIPYFVLGKGSNVLASDRGYAGVLLSLKNGFSTFSFAESPDTVLAEVGAGVSLPALLQHCRECGYGGLEFAAGIPGSLGGAVRMNAGTRHGQMEDVVRWVDVCTPHGEVRRFSKEDLVFQYRRLRLEEGFLILKAALQLKRGSPEKVRALVEEYLTERADQPTGTGVAGSMFKNPPGDYAGRLIEEAGFKGYRAGGARVSGEHANWITADREAKSEDVFAVIRAVQAAVQERFGVTLELEIALLGYNQEELYGTEKKPIQQGHAATGTS
jgi:UDP-N-acetylmuramate dehydrogenase